MRRADRLFQIVQLLRGRRVITASELAAELEVSPRTIYRDIQDLLTSGVPIEGEAGVGYALPRGFDLPPLMFDAGEIEALVVGARMVEAWGDPELARRARSVLAKVETVLPDRLKPRLDDVALFIPTGAPPAHAAKLQPLRRGVNEKRKVHLDYVDGAGRATSRTVRPVCLTFWGTTWLVSAWCELRAGFRSFRPDRMTTVELLEVPFEDEPGKDLEAFLRSVRRDDGDG
ncbi:MAG: YafY family protein [Planctomycetota bacterium]